MRFLAADASKPDFKAHVPAFAARIKALFEPYALSEWFRHALARRPVDAVVELDVEDAAEDVEVGLRRMYLLEDARRWLL